MKSQLRSWGGRGEGGLSPPPMSLLQREQGLPSPWSFRHRRRRGGQNMWAVAQVFGSSCRAGPPPGPAGCGPSSSPVSRTVQGPPRGTHARLAWLRECGKLPAQQLRPHPHPRGLPWRRTWGGPRASRVHGQLGQGGSRLSASSRFPGVLQRPDGDQRPAGGLGLAHKVGVHAAPPQALPGTRVGSPPTPAGAGKPSSMASLPSTHQATEAPPWLRGGQRSGPSWSTSLPSSVFKPKGSRGPE